MGWIISGSSSYRSICIKRCFLASPTSPSAPVTTASIRGASIDTRRTVQPTARERIGPDGCERSTFLTPRHVVAHDQQSEHESGSAVVGGDRASELLKGKALTATIDLRAASAVSENGKVEGSGAYFKNPQGGFGQYYRGPLLEMALIVQHEQNAWPDVRLTNYAGRQIADVIDRQTAFKDLLEIAGRGPRDRWRPFRGRRKGSSHVHRAAKSRGNDSAECILGDRR